MNFNQIKQSIKEEFLKLNDQQQKEVINDLNQLWEDSVIITQNCTITSVML